MTKDAAGIYGHSHASHSAMSSRAQGNAYAVRSARPLLQSKPFAVIAVAVCYLLIEAALWSSGSRQLIFSFSAAAWILGGTFVQGRSARELGVRLNGFRQSSWFLLASIPVAMTVVAIAHATGHLQVPAGHTNLWRPWVYGLWAAEQEFILQSFLFLNFEQLAGTRNAVVLSALLFASAHLPNPVLTICTLIGGLIFSSVFARYRNIWTVAIVHALLGLTIALTAPDSINHHMRVGLGYLRYHAAAPRAAILPPARK